jgi:WD40 repeat protein
MRFKISVLCHWHKTLILRFMKITWLRLLLLGALPCLGAELPVAPLKAPEVKKPEVTVDAMHILKANCFSCHNDQKKKGGLVMTSREALLQGGENGDALVSGSPEKSALLESLSKESDSHMPPKKQLSEVQIETMNRWIKEGARWDASALVDQPSPPRTVTLSALPSSYQPVLAMALSPDATRLAVGCGNQVVIYDAAGTNLAVKTRASAHPDTVQCLAWSSDGKKLASGAFRRVVIWNPESLVAERQITDGLSDRITALRFLPDGTQIVIADGRHAESGMVRIAGMADGKLQSSWLAHEDTIFDLAVSADGKLLATAGGDKFVKLWELAAHKEIAKLEGHVSQVLSLAFDSTATHLISGGADQQLKVWDVKTRERITALGTHTSAINAVTWTGAGAVFAATDAGAVFSYTEVQGDGAGERSAGGKERKLEAAGSTLYCLASSPNGERIFAGSHDGQLVAWNKDGKITSRLNVNEIAVAATAAK